MELPSIWTPVFTGVTTFYESINFSSTGSAIYTALPGHADHLAARYFFFAGAADAAGFAA
jgi:hypothetical protein